MTRSALSRGVRVSNRERSQRAEQLCESERNCFRPAGEVLPGCAVQLASNSTGASRQAVTNDSGSFQITGLLPGDYNLTVHASGFATVTQKVTLEVGQSAERRSESETRFH